MAFARVCSLADVKEPGSLRVELDDARPEAIAVVRFEGEVFAIEDVCSHGSASLAEGEIDQAGCTLECPQHGSRFDLRTGKPLSLPAYVPQETFPVRVQDGVIKLEVD